MGTRIYRSLIFAVCAVAGVALPALGQTTPSVQTASCKVPAARPQPKPYYAEFKTTHVQTLGNGAIITTESTRIQAMDSQNHVLFSNSQTQNYGDHSVQTWANVTDRAAGTQTTWNSQSKKATVIKEPPVEQRHGCWQTVDGHQTRNYPDPQARGAATQSGVVVKPSTVPAPQFPHRAMVSEDLGTMTIQGLEARGQRHTTTTPAGEIGNDQPLVSIQEDWFATGYGFSVRSIRDDPQQGKETTELVKMEQGEPDPAIFLPPEGYETVVEEMVPCKQP
jgi:hypothetical protein